jgi:hypothetical protein
MPELLQHVFVTVVALGAAAVVVRRVAGVVRSPKHQAAPCANCPSAAQQAPHDAAATVSTAKPLTFVTVAAPRATRPTGRLPH